MFLEKVDLGSTQIKNSCVEMVKHFHESTIGASKQMYDTLKRHYYVTPTSYLELINAFKTLLEEKRKEIDGLRNRYENGYDCLIKTEQKVTIM